MICPRLLALYAFLRYMGACSDAECILHDNWQPNESDAHNAAWVLANSSAEYEVTRMLFHYIPWEQRRGAALEYLELKMWRWYDATQDDTARHQIWCLYNEQPASAERLPF